MEVTKNYRRSMGAFAVWDVATETGEIASAVVVGTTKAIDFAHAAESLTRRSNFKPRVMYADTWPHNSAFWKLLFGQQFEGRLGLYHYEHRIVRTLRQGHVDYHKAIRDLCFCIYEYEPRSYNRLLSALNQGLMGRTDDPASNRDINKMQTTTAMFSKNIPSIS